MDSLPESAGDACGWFQKVAAVGSAMAGGAGAEDRRDKSMLPTGGGVPYICGQDIVKVSLVRENGL